MFPVIPGIESLTIFTDNDRAGQVAADTCRERWEVEGCEVRAVMPPKPGFDFNDILPEAAA